MQVIVARSNVGVDFHMAGNWTGLGFWGRGFDEDFRLAYMPLPQFPLTCASGRT